MKAVPLPPTTFEPDPYPARTEISLTEPIEVRERQFLEFVEFLKLFVLFCC